MSGGNNMITLGKAKNFIRLYTGTGENKQCIELVDFSKVEHVWIDDRNYIRITCDGRFYHYPTIETTIADIEIF